MISRSERQGLLFIAPAVLMFAVFVLYSALYTVYASFFQWDGINDKVFIDIQNYVRMFTTDQAFYLSLRNSFYWAIFTIFPQMFLGFVLAYILNSRIAAGTLFRAIFYIPAIVSPVVVGTVWQRIYNPFGGFLSDLGFTIGWRFLQQPFLTDFHSAIFAVIVVNVWQWTGFSMVLYLAGLQSIPREVVEAAQLEGARRWQIARKIVWPMLRHVHLTLILLGVIGTLQTFPLIYTLTHGGPNHATEMLPNYIFQQAFHLQSMGYASALSVVLLVLCLGLSFIQVKFLGARFALNQ
jgi:multiple sugar transport system permease protein/raffinose/stachyose/melibiose transport system permease protein